MKLPRPKRAVLEPPLSPLIDIIFILLIFVVLVARFTDDGKIDVTPPSSRHSEAVAQDGALVVRLDRDGQLSIRGNPIERERLAAVLRAARSSHEVLILMGDRDVALQGAVDVLDAASEAGFAQVGVVTRPRDR